MFTFQYGGRLLEMIAELVSLSEGNSHHPSKDPSQFPQSLPSPSPSPSPPPIEPPQSSYQSSSRSSKPFQKVRVDQSRSRPSHSQNYQKSRMIDHHTSQSDHHHTSSHQSDHHISHMTDHGQSQHKADSGHQSIEQQNMMYQQQMNQQMMINQQMNQQMFQQQQIVRTMSFFFTIFRMQIKTGTKATSTNISNSTRIRIQTPSIREGNFMVTKLTFCSQCTFKLE